LKEFLLEAGAHGCQDEERLGPIVEKERGKVACGRLCNGRLLADRKLRLKLVSDRFGDIALYREDVGQIAIVGLRPQMRIGSGINQLRVNPYAITGSLNTSLQYMRHPKLLADLAQVTCDPALVLHN
jgi:hypothetical protein